MYSGVTPKARVTAVGRVLLLLALVAGHAPPLRATGGVEDPEVLRLQFVLGEKNSFLRAVTTEGVRTYQLPARGKIEELARTSRSLLQQGERLGVETQAEIALSRLSDLLLGPAQEELAAKARIEIFAEGALRRLPFAALPMPLGSRRPGTPAPPERQPLLVDGHEITLHTPSSIPTERCSSSVHSAPSRTIAVFADPVYGDDDPRLPLHTGNEIELPFWAATTRGPDTSSAVFPRLLSAAAEAAAIRALVPPTQALIATGFEASRERVLGGELRDFRILHFATHSLIDPGQGDIPALVLSSVDSDGQPRDGLLTAEDIEQIHLSADLVVLSACQTALGREGQGEKPDGLVRAFLDAGARRVVVTLWEVGDQATAELMSRFYDYLLRFRLSPAAALQQAQRSMWHEPAWSSPFYWAGFVLQGDLDCGHSPTLPASGTYTH